MEKQWFTYGDSVNKNNKPEKCWCCRLGLLTMMTRRKIISRKKGTNERTKDSQAKPNPLLSVFACGTLFLSHIIKCVHGNRTQTHIHTHITWFKRVDMSMLQDIEHSVSEMLNAFAKEMITIINEILLNWIGIFFFSALHAVCLKAWGMRLCVECVICVFVPIFFSK